jgi:hypothetical protein
MSQTIRCYACQAAFSLDPETLRPYRESLIQGQRSPRYWVRCPVCGEKNVIELNDDAEVISGKPASR